MGWQNAEILEALAYRSLTLVQMANAAPPVVPKQNFGGRELGMLFAPLLHWVVSALDILRFYQASLLGSSEIWFGPQSFRHLQVIGSESFKADSNLHHDVGAHCLDPSLSIISQVALESMLMFSNMFPLFENHMFPMVSGL